MISISSAGAPPPDGPLQLIEFIQTGDAGWGSALRLNSDTVDLVFQKIGNLPISVISICGPFRQGKSLLLSYMVRCLEALEKDDEDDDDWMDWNNKTKQLSGFNYRSGIEPETMGVWIWSKPFVVKDDEGKDVALLLLDTQGICVDSVSNHQVMSAVLGLSLLTSSVTIFNIFNDLREDVLSSLSTYAQYGTMALETGLTTPFQKLNFLIRDWNNSTQFPYGAKGGKMFLKAKLEVKNLHSKTAQLVRENIGKCFQELDCFLMPHIGDKALGENFQGSIGELSPKFAKELENFINSVLLSGCVPLRDPVSASSLKSSLEDFVKAYNADLVPSPNIMWRTTPQISKVIQDIEVFIKTLRNQLHSGMKQVTSGKLGEPQLIEMYLARVGSIQQQFELITDFLPKDSPRCRELEHNLQEQLQKLGNQILSQGTDEQRSLGTWHKARMHALAFYKLKMKELSDSSEFLSEEDLKLEYTTARNEALVQFVKVDKVTFPPNALKIKQELKEKIDDDWERLQERNSLRMSVAISEANNCTRQCFEDYNTALIQEMNQRPTPTMQKLHQSHETTKKAVLDRLRKKCPPKNPTFLRKYESELETRIEGTFRELMRKKLEEITAATKEVLVEARKYYHEEMKKHCSSHFFMNPSKLETIHKQVKAIVMEKCKRQFGEFRLSDLGEELEGLLNLYEVQNDMNLNSGDLGNVPAIGIDLGTTYCCVAVYYNGQVHIVPNQEQGGIETIPSYVAFNLDGSETYGAPAKRDAYKNAERTIFDAKRIIGRTINDLELIEDMKFWPFEVKECEGVPKIVCDYKALHPEQVAGKLLTHCKEMAESFLKLPPGTIKKAVITVPAYFNDGQRQATVDAGKLAKLEVLTILNEPTAAAIAYSLERTDTEPRKVLIFDLGGGTFDVAVLSMSPKSIEVLGVKGDTHLGGEDFDKKMMEYCAAQFQAKHGIDLFADFNSGVKQKKDDARRRIRRLQTECEHAKKTLGTEGTVEVIVDSMINGKDLSVTVSRGKFEDLNMVYFEKSIRMVEEALEDVWLTKEEIDDVVLVGGSSRIPKVQQMLSALFDGKALNKSIHPDLAVAYGAAVQAARMNGEQTKGKIDFSEIQDVTPSSLGVEDVTKVLSVIIPKNTKIPANLMQTRYTVNDYQTSTLFKVYQGEDLKIAKNNKLLGTFTLSGIPPKLACKEPLDVWMKINSMGILHVEAICRSTQGMNSITVEADKQRISGTAIQKILEEEAVSVRTHGSFSTFPIVQKANKKTAKTPKNDILWVFLESSLSEEARLRPRILEFQGPHFTKDYEMLKKECTDLQHELSQLDVAGRDDVFAKTKDALHRAKILERRLARKVHVNGKRCMLCEVMSK